MNSTVVAPEVHDFLAAVRAQLADLEPEEQREILDGLEADLADLVAERGGDALGDPVIYARELRTAAGLEPAMARARGRMDLRAGVDGFLDDCHRVWDGLLARMPGDANDALGTLRPVWWVFRGWLAVEVLDLVHRGELSSMSLHVVPRLLGVGWLLVLVAIAISVQLGRNRIWPGDGSRGVAARVVLLVLNVVAIGATPVVVQSLLDSPHLGYAHGFDVGYRTATADGQQANGPKAGLYADGKWISQIYPYDAQGRPLVGVQLFNQIGQPINVLTQPEYQPREYDDQGNEIDQNGNRVEPGLPQLPRIYYPWSNGATELLNVFPLPSRLQDIEKPSPTAFAEPVPPTIGAFPMAHVPVVSLPGIRTGLQKPDVHE